MKPKNLSRKLGIQNYLFLGVMSLFFLFLSTLSGVIDAAETVSSMLNRDRGFPAWSLRMNVWPFDVLYPSTTDAEIADGVAIARSKGANTIIFYIEDEHMYGTFVDQAGFNAMLPKIQSLVNQAHGAGMKVICYVNGLEVMTHNASNNHSIPSMYRTYPDWVQKDIQGNDIVRYNLDYGWITPDMEDAWVCPLSPYRDLFKNRISSLASSGLDGIYIDATFMPGIQPDPELIWGCADTRCNAEFFSRTGLNIPGTVDWNSPTWRKWITFRHEIIAEYLNILAVHAWSVGVVPFWESSTGDTAEATVLGNEGAYNSRYELGYSPEIEANTWQDAYRQAQYARDMAFDHPMLYLGWPSTGDAADREFAIAVCFSGNYYPTADSPWPSYAFDFLNSIDTRILQRRSPLTEIGFVYSVRNKDFTFETEHFFNSYKSVYDQLISLHLPFRILALENLDATVVSGLDTLVISDVESLSDSEFTLLNNLPVCSLGNVGTRDEDWNIRPQPLQFSQTVSFDQLTAHLPFNVDAPNSTWMQFYRDDTNAQKYFVFAFNDQLTGQVSIHSNSPLTVTVFVPGQTQQLFSGNDIIVNIDGSDHLMVFEIVLAVTVPAISWLLLLGISFVLLMLLRKNLAM